MKDVLAALDNMALALCEHVHQWSKFDRNQYELAVSICKEYMKGSKCISICGVEYNKVEPEFYKQEYDNSKEV